MIVFYGSDVSNWCSKVRIVLELKGIPHRVEAPPGGYGSPTYKAIVPSGTIPAIVDGDFVLSESEAINEYLEEIGPEPALLWGTPRDRAVQRSLARFHDLKLEPPIRALFADVDPRRRDAGRVAEKTGEFAARLEELARLGRFAPFLSGERISLADVAYPATLLMAEHMYGAFGLDFPRIAAIETWRAHLAAVEPIGRILGLADTATHAWIAGRQP